MALDDFDRHILALYQHDTRMPGERVGALAERAGQDSHSSAFFAQATRDVRTGGSMTPGGTGHQDRCG